jgi:DNA end-binding protein Ku
MLKLAEHIIKTKAGAFDAKDFHDRYEAALAEVVRAKQEGKPISAKAPLKATNVVSLMDALRQSANPSKAKKSPEPRTAKKAPAERRVAKAKTARKPAARRKAG